MCCFGKNVKSGYHEAEGDWGCVGVCGVLGGV